MLEYKQSKRFKHDLKKVISQKKDISKLTAVVNAIRNSEPLSQKYKDHQLSGKLKIYRECHIEADWLFVYEVSVSENTMYAIATGDHQSAFAKFLS
jgi:mRNA interferase YafQ